MDREAKTALKFIFIIMCYVFFFGTLIAACDTVYESPAERDRKDRIHTERMKICIDSKMQWVEGNCIER